MRDLDNILEVSQAPPLQDENMKLAERLIFLVHEGVDWDVWGGERRASYWEALTQRVIAATYTGPTLMDWWEGITTQISSTPRSVEHRAAVLDAVHARPGDDRSILKLLRGHAQILVLRIRVHTESFRIFTKEQRMGNK